MLCTRAVCSYASVRPCAPTQSRPVPHLDTMTGTGVMNNANPIEQYRKSPCKSNANISTLATASHERARERSNSTWQCTFAHSDIAARNFDESLSACKTHTKKIVIDAFNFSTEIMQSNEGVSLCLSVVVAVIVPHAAPFGHERLPDCVL